VTLEDPNDKIIQIAAGSNHSMILTVNSYGNRNVWVCGKN